jgi:hypothetical protein
VEEVEEVLALSVQTLHLQLEVLEEVQTEVLLTHPEVNSEEVEEVQLQTLPLVPEVLQYTEEVEEVQLLDQTTLLLLQEELEELQYGEEVEEELEDKFLETTLHQQEELEENLEELKTGLLEEEELEEEPQQELEEMVQTLQMQTLLVLLDTEEVEEERTMLLLELEVLEVTEEILVVVEEVEVLELPEVLEVTEAVEKYVLLKFVEHLVPTSENFMQLMIHLLKLLMSYHLILILKPV